MTKQIFLLQCPKCKNRMKYATEANWLPDLKHKKKRCVYCGKTFAVKDNITTDGNQ